MMMRKMERLRRRRGGVEDRRCLLCLCLARERGGVRDSLREKKRSEHGCDRGDDIARNGNGRGSDSLHQTLISNLNVGYGEDKVVDHRQNLSGVGLAKFKTRRVLNYQSRLNRFEALVEEEHQKRDQVDFGFEAHLLKHCGRW